MALLHGRAGRLTAQTGGSRPGQWGWYSNAISSLCSTGWSVMEEEDYNPFVLGGNSSNVPKKPKVRVKAMATGKSAGLYEPYPGMAI
jgi:hypothetical protein